MLFGAFLYQISIFKEKISNVENTSYAGTLEQSSVQKGAIEEIQLLFVGDIMLSRLIGDIMVRNNDWRYPFLETADFLKSADITFGNLEGPISAKGTNMGSMYSFRADPRAIEGLLYAGFDVLSIANNHIWDYGAEAFKETLQILGDNGIRYIGGGYDYEEAHAPVVIDVKGTKIAFLAYTNVLPTSLGLKGSKPAVAFPDINEMTRDIEKAKKVADVIVVSFHWGTEYATTHTEEQETVAHAAIGAGANIIVGHHPHVVGEIEEYDGGYIAYSLGNFVFDQNFSEDTGRGLMFEVTLKNKEIQRIEPLTVTFNTSYQPILIGR